MNSRIESKVATKQDNGLYIEIFFYEIHNTILFKINNFLRVFWSYLIVRESVTELLVTTL